jgi:hypothetical protein
MAITLGPNEVGGLECTGILKARLQSGDSSVHCLWISPIELPGNRNGEQATSRYGAAFGFCIDAREQLVRERDHDLGHTTSIASWYR